jgi:hypothetical protein
MKTVSMIILALLCLTGAGKPIEMMCDEDSKSVKLINNDVVNMTDCARIDLSCEVSSGLSQLEPMIKQYRKDIEAHEGVKILNWERKDEMLKMVASDGRLIKEYISLATIVCEYRDKERTYIEKTYVSGSIKIISGSFSNKRPEDEELLRETLRTARIKFQSAMTLNSAMAVKNGGGRFLVNNGNKNYWNTRKKEEEK